MLPDYSQVGFHMIAFAIGFALIGGLIFGVAYAIVIYKTMTGKSRF